MNKKYTQLTYQLKQLIKREQQDNQTQKAQINKIQDNIIEISLNNPTALKVNTQIELNRIKGTIIKNRNKNITIKLQEKHEFHTNQEVKLHNIQQDIIIKKLHELESSIEDDKINNSNKETLNTIVYKTNTTFQNKEYNIQNLNKNQELAVQRSLNANKFHIIQGPPGTGKTHTIIEIIKQLYKQGMKILITTHTHIALDNILEKLDDIPQEDILRIGNTSKIQDTSKKYTINNQIKQDKQYKEILKRKKELQEVKRSIQRQDVIQQPNIKIEESLLSKIIQKITRTKNTEYIIHKNIKETQNKNYEQKITELNSEIQEIKEAIQNKLLKTIPIIASTVLSSSSYLTKDIEFDYMIMDEASQVPVYLSLIPLMKTNKFILIGDNKQLQPITNNNTIPSLNKSIFNLLIEKYPDNYTFLNIQYRMNHEISDIASKLYYNGRLKTNETNANQRIILKKQENILLNEDPITFIDTSNMNYDETQKSNGCCNKYEVELILNLIKTLISNNISEEEIGIITPYRKQKLYIQKILQKQEYNIETDTIYRFQGREKNIIIISFCKSFRGSLTKFQKRFIADKNQLNVSITRSRKKLILIGNISLLSHAENFQALVRAVSPLNTIFLNDFY